MFDEWGVEVVYWGWVWRDRSEGYKDVEGWGVAGRALVLGGGGESVEEWGVDGE